jgi:hypothetical protein
MYKEYIEKIVDSNDSNKMYELKKLVEDMYGSIQIKDPETFKNYECKLYEIAEGKRLTEEKAKMYVENMKPPAKWSIEDTDSVRARMNVNIPRIDFYVLMNMLYTDYNNVLGNGDTDEELRKYIQMAEDFYNDPDSGKTGEEKVYCYWKITR